MLRFDVPQVWSNVIRLEAFLTFAVAALALAFNFAWLMALLVALGLVRGFFGHHRCPSHHLWKALMLRANCAGKLEDAGAKMFANKILFIASSVSLALFLSGSALWMVPAGMLVVFATLEWAFSFCAAYWVYGAWYRRFPPASA
ncbi:MAG: DUF4395 domain-containing protein [Betaproteobacteria bacterium]|nr:DUF4395 domain-containing protein [Betaproteobacteria bacterium]